jgi:two pore calcium channel protein 2
MKSDAFEIEKLKSETIKSCLNLHPRNYVNLNAVLKHNMLAYQNSSGLSLADFNHLMDCLCYHKTEYNVKPKPTSYPRLIPVQNFILKPTYDYVGHFVAFVNVITLSVEISLYPEHLNHHKSGAVPQDDAFDSMRYINCAIAVYYVIEQALKCWAYGIIYCQKIEFLFDGFVSASLITILIIEQTLITESNTHETEWVWILSRIINILIMLRLLRVLPAIRPLSLVLGALLDALKNLKHGAGILFAAFYLYASIGMLFFAGELDYVEIANSTAHACGSYGQLGYYRWVVVNLD